MCGLPKQSDPNLLVGFDNSDDASVYRISDDVAIIQTVDIFPPVVDDPYHYGQIAAANALSDVYAMGGTPKLALNILCFPEEQPKDIASEILRGGYEKVQEAGAIVVGGHTIKDKEPKYGLSVTGFAKPTDIITNGNAKIGDILILTKPIGTGVLTTAAKADLLDRKTYIKMIEVMRSLNKDVAEVMKNYKVSSCTDITGFGLMGHVYEMAKASNKSIVLSTDTLPLFDAAKEFAEEGIIPAGTYSNRAFLDGKVFVESNVELPIEDLMYDPQTSGGLLIALPEKEGQSLVYNLSDITETVAVIGRVEDCRDYRIIVER